MTAEQLENAIQAAQRKDPIQYSTAPQYRFLRSIKASCKSLPHSNEAADEARKIYFFFLMRFGLPAIFLTVTPDDLRNYRIVVYSCAKVEKVNGNYCPTDFSNDDIMADFQFRSDVRLQHPGLCAEEYRRIVDLVIKHLFNWDSEKKAANGIGLFAEVLAWCLATEEQARKNLHGHFLIFIKDWKEVLDVLHHRKDNGSHIDGSLTYNQAVEKAKAFYNNATSARLFRDFHDKRALSGKDVFHHDCNFRSKRTLAEQKRHFQINPVKDQDLRDMRHKRLCHQHNGKIATCARCNCSFTVNDIVQTALRTHYPANLEERNFCFPEAANNKRLDKLVYELQKKFDWLEDESATDDLQRAKRYFASNALVNLHRPTHANRCFKKGPECYAHLPACPTDKTNILYCALEEYNIWSDCWGNKEKRWMFRFEPQRPLEDVFMNVHNTTITCLLGCNNCVMVGMNGRLVFYCTGYNCKPTQKEERQVFEQVSKVLINVLLKQVMISRPPAALDGDSNRWIPKSTWTLHCSVQY